MSLVTRCPTCATLFKVVPDQLLMAQGWVRCGQCQSVFEALPHDSEVAADPAAAALVVPDVPAATALAPVALLAVARAETELHSPAVEMTPLGAADTDEPTQDIARLSQILDAPDGLAPLSPEALDREIESEAAFPMLFGSDAAPPDAEPVPASVRPSVLGWDASMKLDLDLAALEAEAAGTHEAAAVVWGQGESSLPHEASSDLTALASQSAELSAAMGAEAMAAFPSGFESLSPSDLPPVQAPIPDWAQRPARRSAPGLRLIRLPNRVWIGFCVLLVLGLLLQVALLERDRLAAMFPATKPALQALCEPLACTIRPPRQLDALVIDNSAFNRVKSGAYRLSFTVNNVARFAVAAPALELTLTDAQDKPLVRRVFRAAEAGLRSDVLQARGEWSETLHLWLESDTADADKMARVSGYHLLVFYPE